MLDYWIPVVKGISLLQMAYDAPNVAFSEGTLTIRRQKDKLDRQDQTFKAVVGENTVRLVELALSRPSSTIITLLTDEGFGIPSLNDLTSQRLFIKGYIPTHRTSEDQHVIQELYMWEIHVGRLFDAGLRSHVVRFVHNRFRGYMSHDGPKVSTVKNCRQFTSISVSWLIMPVCPGSNRYTIRTPGRPNPFRFLSPYQDGSDFFGSHLVARDFLKLEKHVSSSDSGTKFQIKV